jgi:hypothetical protein
MGEAVVSEAVAAPTAPLDSSERAGGSGERAARLTLRGQIARLEAELSRSVVRSFEMRGSAEGAAPRSEVVAGAPRLLDLGELERVRDELATRVGEIQAAGERLAESQAAARALLERMLLEPGRHRFTRIPLRELGEPGCGVWHVRPRLGLIGMLAGWWQITLSSGCPLPGGGMMRALLRTGTGAVVLLSIMIIGSIVLWVGAPLLWLWIGSQVQGHTESLDDALAVAFVGVVISIALLASVLSRLSDVYRANRIARGGEDPGHVVLEAVLVVSAAITMTVFAIWFFFFAGAAPAPIGIQI